MYMSREEARQALVDGKRVRHFNFTSSEFLVMEGGRIMTEDGYFFGDQFDGQDWMETGWVEVPAPSYDSLFEAVQVFPKQFAATAYGRASTTPSVENRKNHLNFVYAVENGNWEAVKILISHPNYHKPLHGVCVCLETYSDIPQADWIRIVDLYDKGQYI